MSNAKVRHRRRRREWRAGGFWPAAWGRKPNLRKNPGPPYEFRLTGYFSMVGPLIRHTL